MLFEEGNDTNDVATSSLYKCDEDVFKLSQSLQVAETISGSERELNKGSHDRCPSPSGNELVTTRNDKQQYKNT